MKSLNYKPANCVARPDVTVCSKKELIALDSTSDNNINL